ncbi:MAG: hypothetical protein LBR51_02150 [Bacteroidales bacterium]|jgi:membrane-bound ClpP family serine protease|nr:hypothetical protein [Bacteroidales bacterium]
MNIALIVVLILLGIVCIILELLVLPGGITGIIGVMMMTGGVVGAYVSRGHVAGNITLLITLLVFLVSVFFVLQSKTWKKLMLKTKIESKMNEIDTNKIQVGMTGITLSRLAPMGKAKINGEIVEVTSPIGFIDEHITIEVVKIEGNKIIIKTEK